MTITSPHPPGVTDSTHHEAGRPVLEIRHLHKEFGSVTAVVDASLELAAGQVMVLLGESGSGKTTILRCVAGLESLTGGQVVMNGDVVADERRQEPPERRGVGMVFQNYALWPHMSARQNVAFAGCRNLRSRRQRRAAQVRAVDLLERVGLGALKDRYPAQLSGGQQQRVALARALAGDVRLLLMDEPLSALDRALREELRLELRNQIKQTGLACLYVTHDQHEALAMADVLVVMRRGVIEELGNPRAIYEQPRTAFGAKFLGATNCVVGTVTDAADDALVAEVGGSAVRFSASGWQPSTGDRVELRWRREDTAVRRPDSSPVAANEWPVRCRSTVYLGSAWELAVDLLGFDVRAWCHDQLDGDLLVSVEPSRLWGYPAGLETDPSPLCSAPTDLDAPASLLTTDVSERHDPQLDIQDTSRRPPATRV